MKTSAAAIKVWGEIMDNMLFVGGIMFSAISLIAGIVYFVVYRIRAKRLDKALDKEYGKNVLKSK